MLSWEYPPSVSGGLGAHVAALAPELAARGCKVRLVVPNFADAPAMEKHDGLQVLRAPVGPSWGDIVAYSGEVNAGLVAGARDVIEREGGRFLIHAHDWLVGAAAAELKHAHHFPLVATIHATEWGRNHGNLYGKLQQAIHFREWQLTYEAWRVICCSSYMADEVKQVFATPADKVDVIPNGIDPHKFAAVRLDEEARRCFRARFARPEERLLYFVGRLVREKGLDVLLDAMPRVLERLPEVKLVVAGTGPALEGLRRKAASLPFADKVFFTGFISDLDRDCLYLVADAAIFPSLYEPFGIVALEAMAAGTPVIVSDAGGFSEVVRHNETGIRVHAGDPESLAWGILHTLLHPQWSRARAANALRDVHERFSWGRIADQTMGVYRRVWNEYVANPWAAPETPG